MKINTKLEYIMIGSDSTGVNPRRPAWLQPGLACSTRQQGRPECTRLHLTGRCLPDCKRMRSDNEDRHQSGVRRNQVGLRGGPPSETGLASTPSGPTLST
eukprot:7271043-Alexandrium_andersonii.AAC.1